MIAAEFITKYPSLFICKDYTLLDLFIKNEIGFCNKPLKKVLTECIDKNLFFNEKFFKLLYLIKSWEIDPDSASKIIKSKMDVCLSDEFSSIKTENLWIDYFFLEQRTGIGSFVITYSEKDSEHPEIIKFFELFSQYQSIDKDIDKSTRDSSEQKVYFKTSDENTLTKIKEEYVQKYKNVLVFFKEVGDKINEKSNIRLEILSNQLFLNMSNNQLIKFGELKNLPKKDYKVISGYDLSGKYFYDLENEVEKFPNEVKKQWNYYSYFIKSNIRIDDVKKIKNFYSKERLKIMLKNDFFNVNLNQMSIFLNQVPVNDLRLLPKKPKNITDLETQLMILQLANVNFNNYSYPQKFSSIHGLKFGDYVISLPVNRKDLITLSRLMKNCLFEAHWDDKVHNNNEFIIILLKNNRPEVIISLDKSGSLLEALGRCNCEISDDLRNQIILSLIPLVK